MLEAENQLETGNIPENKDVAEAENLTETGNVSENDEHRVLADRGELEDFKKGCFGHYLDLPEYMQGLFQAQYIHNLLFLQIWFMGASEDEMWFSLGKNKRRSSGEDHVEHDNSDGDPGFHLDPYSPSTGFNLLEIDFDLRSPMEVE
ncbi:hypothetical protein QYF36_023002 [Acer negundo]|nr:hypothetical protein QYF36_023002 [Acer negundo]